MPENVKATSLKKAQRVSSITLSRPVYVGLLASLQIEDLRCRLLLLHVDAMNKMTTQRL
jgi:hypothetical protein